MSASTSRLPTCPRIRHLVSGTFNTPFLHVFAYDTLSKQLSLAQSIHAQGPHQFLALGRTASFPEKSSGRALEGARIGRGFGDVLYATTWAHPPSLSAWKIVGLDQDKVGRSLDGAGSVTLEWINTAEISEFDTLLCADPGEMNR
jgi:carboxy-cis,cis-muconate cyclase